MGSRSTGISHKFRVAVRFSEGPKSGSQPLKDTIHGQRFMKDGRSYNGGQKVAFFRGRGRTVPVHKLRPCSRVRASYYD